MPRREDRFKPCTILGCDRPLLAIGLCRMHYYRNKRHGDPLYQRTPESRFWVRVNKNGPLHPNLGTQCWLWDGYIFPTTGYGGFKIGNKLILIHRYSWTLHNGPILATICVLHHCDNKLCVNPNHLFLGTKTDNNADRDKKDRQAKGENNGTARLTDNQIQDIREKHKMGLSYRTLALEYNIDYTQIGRIVTRKQWRHI